MSVLRRVFGPSRKEIWQQLSDRIGARYVDGGSWKGDKVQAHVKEWTVTLDTYVVSTGKSAVVFTRMRAPYVNADGFRFTVYRKSLFTGLGKMLGMRDVEVGFPDFDQAFVVRGTDESKLRSLFADPKIRELLQSQPKIHLEVRDDEGWFAEHFPEGVDELRFHVAGVIKDPALLQGLYDLFAEVLGRLCEIGSAYETDPNVAL